MVNVSNHSDGCNHFEFGAPHLHNIFFIAVDLFDENRQSSLKENIIRHFNIG